MAAWTFDTSVPSAGMGAARGCVIHTRCTGALFILTDSLKIAALVTESFGN